VETGDTGKIKRNETKPDKTTASAEPFRDRQMTGEPGLNASLKKKRERNGASRRSASVVEGA
jgi:hypothetical protein